MDSYGEKRKRKVENEEEESEEEKIEKFFALIRSTREIHERINGPKEGGEKKKKPDNVKKANGWKPSFQPQDFMVDARLKIIIDTHQGSFLPGPSKKKEVDENKDKELMADTQLMSGHIDEQSLLPGPSKKIQEEEEEEEEKEKENEKEKEGGGLDLDLKL